MTDALKVYMVQLTVSVCFTWIIAFDRVLFKVFMSVEQAVVPPLSFPRKSCQLGGVKQQDRIGSCVKRWS